MRFLYALTVLVLMTTGLAAEEPRMPPQVTPALRAACEADVRRMCTITPDTTVAEVRVCVMENFGRLGRRCKFEITLAGLKP